MVVIIGYKIAGTKYYVATDRHDLTAEHPKNKENQVMQKPNRTSLIITGSAGGKRRPPNDVFQWQFSWEQGLQRPGLILLKPKRFGRIPTY
jgi:hypothetical protein